MLHSCFIDSCLTQILQICIVSIVISILLKLRAPDSCHLLRESLLASRSVDGSKARSSFSYPGFRANGFDFDFESVKRNQASRNAAGRCADTKLLHNVDIGARISFVSPQHAVQYTDSQIKTTRTTSRLRSGSHAYKTKILCLLTHPFFRVLRNFEVAAYLQKDRKL